MSQEHNVVFRFPNLSCPAFPYLHVPSGMPHPAHVHLLCTIANMLRVQPLVKSLFCPIRQSPNGFFDSEVSIP